MGNKYYTPTIEEFHVGFEYETYELYETPNRWKINIFGEEHMELDHIVFLLMEHPDMIRVKYLDKEDIESLGWEFNYNMSVVSQLYYLYEKKGYDLSVWYRKEGLLLVIRKVNKSSDNIVVHSHSIFYGYIKNKSELKILLKQLGIE